MDQSYYSLTTCIVIGVGCGFAGLVIGASGVYFYLRKCKRGSDESQDRYASLGAGRTKKDDEDPMVTAAAVPKAGNDESNESNLVVEQETPKTDDKAQMAEVLKTLKTELENQMDEVQRQLEEAENEKQTNKEKLRSVEKEITKREATYDKPEELLKQKEDLLQTEWRLDERKRIFEKQEFNINKLMDPVEAEVTRVTRSPQSSR